MIQLSLVPCVFIVLHLQESAGQDKATAFDLSICLQFADDHRRLVVRENLNACAFDYFIVCCSSERSATAGLHLVRGSAGISSEEYGFAGSGSNSNWNSFPRIFTLVHYRASLFVG